MLLSLCIRSVTCLHKFNFNSLLLPLLLISTVPMTLTTAQERSFRRGIAYIIAMVSEFDEYTNDWLYLREGSLLPK